MAVRITANFERNLGDIEAFLAEADAGAAFHGLIEHLSGEIIPTLEQFPDLGADFLARAPLSVEGRVLFEKIARMAGSDIAIRQRVGGEYLLLYAVRGGSVFLLSIRHQRQLSFDLAAHWP